MTEDRHRFQLWQDGIMVAAVDCPNWHSALKEISHYAAVYEQDGPVRIVEVKRRSPGTCGGVRMTFIQESFKEIASLKAERDALVKALQEVIEANNDFRKGMPEDWDGDLLQDACDDAAKLLVRVGRVKGPL